jgi:hypothetical protein
LIALLVNHDKELLYIPGRIVNRATGAYRGEGKTDARDAAIIADQARMRRDLHSMCPGDDIVAELKILTARRTDLTCDRTRTINRLRAQLTGVFPALERALDVTLNGPLTLLSGYQTPAALRRLGHRRLEAWLRNRKVRNATQLAAAATAAAESQHTVLPAERLAAQLVCTLARETIALSQQLAEVDKLIESRFREHKHAEVILSMPRVGPVLGAEFHGRYRRRHGLLQHARSPGGLRWPGTSTTGFRTC